MSLTYCFVGWFQSARFDSVVEQLSLLPGMSSGKERRHRITDRRTTGMGVAYADEEYDCFAKSHSVDFMIEGDNPDIMTFTLDMTAMSPKYPKTSLNIINILAEVCLIVQPIIVVSVAHGFEEDLLLKPSLAAIVTQAAGICYICKELMPDFVRDEDGNLYRIKEYECGYIFASPFGLGNEHIYLISGHDDEDYFDDELGEILTIANNKHVPAIRSLVQALRLDFCVD